MIKKILYVGGFAHAEYSMWQSFKDHGIDMHFLQEANYPNYKLTEPHITYFDKKPESEQLGYIIKEYEPDLVIHRYCSHFPGTFPHSYDLVKSFGIPYIVYRMESCWDGLPQVNYIPTVPCDLFLYANHIDIPFLFQENKAYWAWGVSQYDKNLHLERTIPLAGFGYSKHTLESRTRNIKVFIKGCFLSGNTTFCVFGPSKGEKWKNDLITLPEFTITEQIRVINQTHIALNFETCPDVPGVYSYKMFQSMACGTPTISFYKPTHLEMFEGALIEVHNSEEISNAIKSLQNNPELWNSVSEHSESVLRKNFDWYNNFEKATKGLITL